MIRRLTAVAMLLAVALVPSVASAIPANRSVTITLLTHDSFAVSKSVLKAFTKQTGIKVKVVKSGDAGAALNQVILTKGHPLADAMFGVDNTFLSRAVKAGVFAKYTSPQLAHVPAPLQLDRTHHLTPTDYGDVCINADKKAFASGTPIPQTLDDLTKPAYKNDLVVENPATSSPGLAFLLATISRYGPGWRDYWKKLKANGVKVDDGWEQAYSTDFSGSSGKGPDPLVVSYASSPPAEVLSADPPPKEAPTVAVLDTCFRQVEFVGVLTGAAHPKEARKLVDFMLSNRFQADVPLQMYVYPARTGTALPEVFTKYAKVASRPWPLSTNEIGRERDTWIEQWTSTVLR